ncbi:hypothetical protein PR048_011361 [Dryococelus australis]|uniref:HTH psq-type domain-containing protein n=1 Tax=Dryococelus australis TaxID=614101 RepID=A0ABQ9HLC5_9NEOP|nr:hypothetical protein PR048_011361 [Dryococelus australis]
MVLAWNTQGHLDINTAGQLIPSSLLVSVVMLQSVKRKQVMLKLKQNVKIYIMLERGMKVSGTKKEYGIVETTVYDIKKNSAKLKMFMANSKPEKNVDSRKTLHTA